MTFLHDYMENTRCVFEMLDCQKRAGTGSEEGFDMSSKTIVTTPSPHGDARWLIRTMLIMQRSVTKP